MHAEIGLGAGSLPMLKYRRTWMKVHHDAPKAYNMTVLSLCCLGVALG